MNDNEVMSQALRIAREIVGGSISPVAGAAAIWTLSSENDRACFNELKPFIAAASQWDESPKHRNSLEEDAARAAQELLDRHPVD